jgi:hypothetical protein
VTAYAGGADYLAAGYANGDIRVWSKWACPSVTLPRKEAVHNIWWNGFSPFIAACGQYQQQISVYDLRSCSRTADVPIKGPVKEFAVSPQGAHLACVDAGRRVWTGTIHGLNQEQATLRYKILDLVFTPGAGLFMAADRMGWLILWSLPDYEVWDQMRIPGGPFERGYFEQDRLILYPENKNAKPFAWDIPAGSKTQMYADQARFILKNNVLYSLCSKPRWVKKAILSDAGLQAFIDPDRGIIQVLDLDGEERYYQAGTGMQIPAPKQGRKLKPVPITAQGKFVWNDVKFRLADPVLVQDHWALWARYVSDQGYYLWWTENADVPTKEYDLKLPRRQNIRAEIPAEWIEIK